MTDHTEGRTPLSDEDLAQIRDNHARATEDGLKQHVETLRYAQSASDVPRLLDEVDRLRAELNKTRREFKDSRDSLMGETSRLRAENTALVAKLDAAREMHQPSIYHDTGTAERYLHCVTCDQTWPCHTAAALGGDQDGGDRG
jgi:hypothetical protein